MENNALKHALNMLNPKIINESFPYPVYETYFHKTWIRFSLYDFILNKPLNNEVLFVFLRKENDNLHYISYDMLNDFNALNDFLIYKTKKINSENKQSPPVGLKPKFINRLERLNYVKGEMTRYFNSGLEVPIEWVEEYNELINEIKKKG